MAQLQITYTDNNVQQWRIYQTTCLTRTEISALVNLIIVDVLALNDLYDLQKRDEITLECKDD